MSSYDNLRHRMPRSRSTVTKRREGLDSNPLLAPSWNPLCPMSDTNLPPNDSPREQLHSAAETEKTAMPSPHQELLTQQLDELERIVTELERELDKRERTYATDEDWDNGTEADDEDDVDSADDDDDKQDDDDDDLDKVAARIAARSGRSKTESLSKARELRPDLYQKAQRGAAKKSFAQLVETEIAKGCSPIVAAQRVATLYPDIAARGDDIAKANDAVGRFLAKCNEVMQARGCSRTEAMQVVRRAHPREFSRFQNV